ncbi:MAG TPA: glycosyltransferase family 39 protein [Gemmatimonadaceae bacterium]
MMPARTPAQQGFADRSPGREWAVLGVILAVAAVLRLYNLGALGLQVDEGVHALAVQGWLSDGLPILPSGAVYQRSIPFVALQVITARLVGVSELALRLPAALFGVAAVAATYGLARVMFDRRVAVIAATFIALSAWEIELSRYGRFYTAFQVCYVAAFMCLYRVLSGGTRVWTFGFVAASLAAITLHELAIVIAVCFLVPLFDREVSWPFRARSVAGMAVFVAVWVAYRRLAGPWFVATASANGLEAVYAAQPPINSARILPFLPAVQLPEISSIGDALLTPTSGIHLVLLVSAAGLWLTFRRNALREGVLLALAITFGLLHLFMMSALVLLAWFVWFGQTWRDAGAWRVRPALYSLAASLGLWTVSLWNGSAGWRSPILALFGFPGVLKYFAYWFATGWPFFLAATMILGSVMLVRYFRTRERALLYVPAGIVIPVVTASLFASYEESRYVFHLYPLLVVAFAWGCVRIGEWLNHRYAGRLHPVAAYAAVAAVAMLATRDIGSLTIAPLTRTYGEARDAVRSVISWPVYGRFHQDQAGAAAYVREHSRPGDRVVAIGLPHQLNVYRFYIGQLDAALTRPENASYQRLRRGALVDWVTGAAVFNSVQEMAESAGTTTWLIGDTAILAEGVTYFSEPVRDDARRLAARAEFHGRDGVTYVVKLP